MELHRITEFEFYRGRVALAVALKALGIRGGEEVAIQAFTCVAVPEGVIASGGIPRYVDVEENGINLDWRSLEGAINSRTKAIVVQHTFGIPCDLVKIEAVASKYGIPIIEDCCHTLTSTYRGRTVGEFGQFSFYSYEWGKPIVAGLGGSLRVNEERMRQKVAEQFQQYEAPPLSLVAKIELQYVAHHLTYRPEWYWPVRSAFQSLSAMGAAEGNYHELGGEEPSGEFAWRMARPVARRIDRKSRTFSQALSHARSVSRRYAAIPTSVARPIDVPSESVVDYARFPLWVDEKDSVLGRARSLGVELAGWYSSPVHPLGRAEWMSVGYEPGACPNAERASKHIVSLPVHRRVSERYIDRVISMFDSL